MNAARQQEWSREFEPETYSVRAARRFVLETPAARDVDVGALELAVSELVSNAVLHARTPFVVTIQQLPDGIRVEVVDGDTRLPRPMPVDPISVTGRGLRIVDSLVRRWAAESRVSGKTVWFELGTTTA